MDMDMCGYLRYGCNDFFPLTQFYYFQFLHFLAAPQSVCVWVHIARYTYIVVRRTFTFAFMISSYTRQMYSYFTTQECKPTADHT